MERHGVIVLPVVEDGGRVVGVVHLHDLLRAGAV
jgi:arabinose-5-phosphate isomerase